MGAVIEAVGVSTPRVARRDSSIALASEAARMALAECSATLEDVDLLVNAGVYRHENICEPSMASLIQRQIGTRSAEDPLGTFSFDLSNGGCGLLNAVQVVDAFLRSGARRRALIVTSDVDPTPERSEGIAFEPAGGAILLRPGASDEGFLAFGFETFSKHSDLCVGQLDFVGGDVRGRWGTKLSNHRIALREGEAYAKTCASCASAALERFLGAQQIPLSEIDLVVTSPSPRGFTRAFAESSRIPMEQVVAERSRAHTAGPVIALRRALDQGDFAGARTVLFATVGAGISVSLALYRHR